MNRYIRHGTATFDEIIPAVLENWAAPANMKKRLELQGFKMGIGSLRLVTFARAFRDHGCIKCVQCGAEASFFSIDSFPSASAIPSVHLNLFGIKQTPLGPEDLLFTHDHILARGLGGADDLENTQVMCSVCNSKKGTIEGKLVEKLRKEKAEALKNQDDLDSHLSK
jgi:hypothetical protein